MRNWYGLIPTEWKEIKTKYIFNLINGGTPKSDVEKFWSKEVVWITPEDLSKGNKHISESNRMISFEGLNNCSARLIKDFSIVLSTRAPIGNLKISTVPFTTNQGCKSLEPKTKLDIDFYYYLLYLSKEHLNSLGRGTTFLELSNSSLKDLILPLPSYSEQSKISLFLTNKINTIDSIVQKKVDFIKLLNQQRQSIITEAVTKGLNPNVKMKDSGVEWIGEIPEHWEVSKIKYKFSIEKLIKPKENPIVLSLTQRGLKIKDLNDFSGQHADSYDKYQEVKIKDYVMNGMDLLTGYVDCSELEGVTSPDYRVFRIRNDEESHDYFLRYFQICYFSKIFYGHGQGVSSFGRWRLQTEVFKDFPIPVPSITEQYEISNFLKDKESYINNSISTINLQIEKLKEYRQSLIYEAVTGKIDISEMELEEVR